MSRRATKALAYAAGVLAIAAGSAPAASADSFSIGNVRLDLDSSISPSKLPQKKRVPATLKFHLGITANDGGRPPALQDVSLDFNRAGITDIKGLAKCNEAKLANTTTEAALAACRKALLGRGLAIAAIEFPDQAPFDANAPVLVFNAGKVGGQQKIVSQSYALTPAPTTFIVPVSIEKGKGIYGTHVEFRIPEISSGYGSLRSLDIQVGRRWKVRKVRRSYITARCPVKGVTIQPFAHAAVNFSDGAAGEGTIFRACRVAR
jgi:hypothetical protein